MASFDFTFNVSDQQGFTDINHSRTLINITLGGKGSGQQQAYNNSNCTINEYNTDYVEYLCTVLFNYYNNASSNWVVNVSVADYSDATALNDTMRFTVNELTAIRLIKTAVNFSGSSVVAGATDVAAATNPFIINNTGNFDFTTINITGQNMTGVTTPAEVISPANITVNASADAPGIPMVDNTTVNIPGAALIHGEPGIGNLSLYFYIDIPSGLSVQVYNVTIPWRITLE